VTFAEDERAMVTGGVAEKMMMSSFLGSSLLLSVDDLWT
jgi:hypothetical protein